MDKVTVFAQGADGYHSCRIPALLSTASGALLAFAEGRVGRHDHSENDIIVKRSTDGGATWSAAVVAASDGRNCLNNPLAVLAPEGGRVLLMYQRFPYGFHEADNPRWYQPEGLRSVGPGYDQEPICRSYLVTSDDDGVSWAAPRELTGQVKFEAATALAGGPGVGVVKRRPPHQGRLLMPFNTRFADDARAVYVAYSDDGGASWQRGAAAPEQADWSADEVQVVELADGSVLLNARSSRGVGCRCAATSNDAGASWSTLERVPELTEPGCMGSVIRYGDPLDGEPSTLLFSNPASTTERAHGAVALSSDEGTSWPQRLEIEAGRFAYSCLTRLADGTVGCLYETGDTDSYERIVLSRFAVADLTG